MQPAAMTRNDSEAGIRRPWTGWTVLGWIIGFFAVIFIANGIFMWLALSSFSGIEATSAYKAGQTFSRDKSEAGQQAARGWQVTADFARAGAGLAIRLDARDRDGAPLTGMAFSTQFRRPAEDGSDVIVTLGESESGVYSGSVEAIGPGQWTVVITGEGIDPQSGQPQRMYLSRNRILLRD